MYHHETETNFVTVTSKKTLGCDGKITSELKNQLSRGFIHEVDGFSFHYNLYWAPSKLWKKRPVKQTVGLKKRPTLSKIKVIKPAFILPWDTWELMMEVNQLERAQVAQNLIDGLNPFDSAYVTELRRKARLASSKRILDSGISSPVTEGVAPSCDWKTIQQAITKAFFDKKKLLREGVEANPGPDYGCDHTKIVKSGFTYIFSNVREEQLYEYRLHVSLRRGDPRVIRESNHHCYLCRKRFFFVIVYTYENSYEFANRISRAWYNHPSFGYEFMLEHLASHCEKSWCRDLCSDGIEPNPGPGDENTKRDSKSHKEPVSVIDRLARLSMRSDDIGSDSKAKKTKLVKRKRQNAAHKQVMRELFPKKQFSIDVNHNHEFQFLADLERILNTLPDELRGLVKWTDVVVSISAIVRSKSWEAKYLAMSTLYKLFKVKGIAIGAVMALMNNVLRDHLSVKDDVLRKQSSYYAESNYDSITSVVTLVLVFFFGKKPNMSHTNHIVASLGNLPRQAGGIQFLVDLVKRVSNYVMNETTPQQEIENRIREIQTSISKWMTKEGNHALMNSEQGFDEITELVLRAQELSKVVPTVGPLRMLYSSVNYHLQNLYKRVQMSPVSGHAFRKEPVVLHLCGKPGVGKTLMVNAISADALKVIFELAGDSIEDQKRKLSEYFKFVYYKPVGNKYHTNYNSSYSKIYIVDDANQVNPSKLNLEDTPFPVDIINLANNQDHLLNVAEIENKRTAKFNSDLIIATDNEVNPELSYLSSPEAYKRRIDLEVWVTLKPGFTRNINGVVCADPLKFRTDQFDTEPYIFTIAEVNYDYAEFITILTNMIRSKHARFHINKDNFIKHAMRHNDFVQQHNNEDPVQEFAQKQMKSWHIEDELFGLPELFRINIWMQVKLFFFWKVKFPLYKHFDSLRSKWTKTDETSKKKVRTIASVALLLLSAFTLWKFRTGKTDDKTRRRENYSSGDASKTKTRFSAKPNSRPVGKVVARKHNQDFNICVSEAKEFCNEPIKESCADSINYNLARLLATQQYEITISCAKLNVTRHLRGMFVTGKLFLCNAHILDTLDGNFDDCLVSLDGPFGSFHDIELSSIDIFHLEHDDSQRPYDVIFMQFPRTVKDHSKVVDHFMKKDDMSKMVGKKCVLLTVRNNSKNGINQWFVERQHTYIRDLPDDYVGSQSGDILTFNWGTAVYNAQSEAGYCGSIILVNDSTVRCKILGIHMAGYDHDDLCFGALVSREMIDAVLESASPEAIRGLPSAHLKTCKFEKKTVIDNNFNHIMEIPDFVHSQNRTRISEGLLFNRVFETTKAPARLGYFEGDHVVNKAIQKYRGVSTAISKNKQDLFGSALSYSFSRNREVTEFDIQTSIRGIEENDFVRAINRSSSPGYPFIKLKDFGSTGKTSFLGENLHFIYDNPILLKYINEYKECVERNERPVCLFTSTAKDELRTLEKVNAGKTRCFAAAPLHFVVMFRQQFLDLFANIMENRIHNTSLVGINVYGKEWDLVVRQLIRVAHPGEKQFLAGDFTNFDGTLNRDLLWCIFDFIESQYDRNSQLSNALWTDITSSLQLFGNSVIEVSNGQPSGNPGTAIINTLYNAGLMFLVLSDILSDLVEQASTLNEKKEISEIRRNLYQHFSPMFYGDDNLMAFSADFCKFVDPRLITLKMKTFGHIYTSDLKDTADLQYRTLADVSILKRHFVYDKKLRFWFAPLNLESILEPLNWDKVDPRQDEEKKLQAACNARTAIRELSMHDLSIFSSYKKRIIDECMLHDVKLEPDCFLNQENLRRDLKNLNQPSMDLRTIVVTSKMGEVFTSSAQNHIGSKDSFLNSA